VGQSGQDSVRRSGAIMRRSWPRARSRAGILLVRPSHRQKHEAEKKRAFEQEEQAMLRSHTEALLLSRRQRTHANGPENCACFIYER
jgi:hypothetical protein